MHQELVKRLRNLAGMIPHKHTLPSGADTVICSLDAFMQIKELAGEAADAIEKLSRKETPMKITEIHVDEYYCPACGAENNCDQGDVQDAYCPVCGQRLLPEPTKEGQA